MKTLEGKVAVITGASRGIGAAIARRLAVNGAAVVVNYSRSGEAAESLVAEICSGGEAIAVQGDVSTEAGAKALVAAAAAKYGKIDILVNNAGVAEFAPIEGADESHIRRQFDLNVMGVTLVTREALAHFSPDGGSIVNLSSTVGKFPVPSGSVYSASKAAVDGLTVAWARELGGRNIRVNAVAPGPVETDMLSAIDEGSRNYFLSRMPLARLGQPDDIADAVAFLVSPGATWITGQTLGVDGGIIP